MDNFIFYVVVPDVLNFPFEGLSLQERRFRLRDTLKSKAAQWESVRLRGAFFLDYLESLAKLINSSPAFEECFYESSPANMLPHGRIGDYNPMFGYFEPADVLKYDQAFRDLAPEAVQQFEEADADGVHSLVWRACSSTFSEAASRRAAIAIDHS
jgi:hypothetical protein